MTRKGPVPHSLIFFAPLRQVLSVETRQIAGEVSGRPEDFADACDFVTAADVGENLFFKPAALFQSIKSCKSSVMSFSVLN